MDLHGSYVMMLTLASAGGCIMECEDNSLVECGIIPDTYMSGVGKVEILGPNARIWLYVDQESSGRTERIVVAKIIVPLESIPGAIKVVLIATAKRLTIPPLLENFRLENCSVH